MNVQIDGIEPQKFPCVPAICLDFGRRKGTVRKTLPQTRGDGDGSLLLIVDCDSSQVFPIAEAFHQLLQSPPRTFLQSGFDALLQAVGKDLGAPLQVLLQPAPLSLELGVREKKRHERQNNNQRANQTKT